MPNTIGTIFQEIYHLGLWCGAMSLGVMSIVRSVGNQLTLVQSILYVKVDKATLFQLLVAWQI